MNTANLQPGSALHLAILIPAPAKSNIAGTKQQRKKKPDHLPYCVAFVTDY